ncbi:hypothetical protein ABZX34_28615 [Streptomyces sp. NPDC004362]|uniref:hypothetical protein n=1 Tax=unclassified Streptomyces TaxID=2593676 RepID=UPI0033AC5784
MWTFVGAATGLPSILFTAALVVVVCFWLLVAVGATTASSFDSDVDLDAWGIGGVPVSVSLSLVTVFSWFLTVGSTALLPHVLESRDCGVASDRVGSRAFHGLAADPSLRPAVAPPPPR